MNGCKGNTSDCTGRDIQPVRIGLSHEERLFCRDCRVTAARMGLFLRVVERRLADVPVAHERRGVPRPAWLARLTAREDTWAA